MHTTVSHPPARGLILAGFNFFIERCVHKSIQRQYYFFFPKFPISIGRLERCMETSSPSIFPFVAKNRVIEDLKETSFKFKERCVNCDSEK